MAVYGAWASWRAAIPRIITMHGGRYYADRLRRRLALRAAIALSGRTVAVSSRLAHQIGKDLWIPSSRITTIANGVRFVRPERTTLREELRLDRLLSDPSRARDLGERAAGHALAEYDVSHMVRRYVCTYEELLGRCPNVVTSSWAREALVK